MVLFGQEPEDMMYPPRLYHPAEVHLKRTVNSELRQKPGWWVHTEAGHAQREYLRGRGWAS